MGGTSAIKYIFRILQRKSNTAKYNPYSLCHQTDKCKSRSKITEPLKQYSYALHYHIHRVHSSLRQTSFICPLKSHFFAALYYPVDKANALKTEVLQDDT
jgi:hypothetical protein